MKFFHQNFDREPQITHRKGLIFAPHLHNAVEIVTLFSGRCKLSVDGIEHNIGAGDFLIVFPNYIHSYIAEEGVDSGVIIFNPEDYPELKKYFYGRRPKSPVVRSEELVGTEIANLALELVDNYNSSSSAAQKGYILLLVGKLFQHIELEDANIKHDDTVSRVFEYCRNNYLLKITLQDVANALHISKSYLSHIFCCKMNINFCDYLNILRTNEAVKLLCETDKSITEIAESSGFSTIRTFNRAFLKHTGMTPGEYRRDMK